MSIIEAISFFGLMLALAAIPSASVALVVTRSATLGLGNGLAVSAGIVLGDLVFILVALLGLSFVAETLGSLFFIIKVLGGLYLIYLGISLMKNRKGQAGTQSQIGKGSLLASFVSGFVLTLGDVKAILFYASLLPMMVDFTMVGPGQLTVIMLITIFSVGSVKVLYALSASKLARLKQGSKLPAISRKAAGGMMIGVGGYLILEA